MPIPKEFKKASEKLRGRKILIIDDQPTTLDNYKAIFNQAGAASITTANNGREAIEILKSQPDFDLIVTDLNMPYVSGTAFLQHIRRNPSLTSCKSFILQSNLLTDVDKSYVKFLNGKFKQKDRNIVIQCREKGGLIGDFLSDVVSLLNQS